MILEIRCFRYGSNLRWSFRNSRNDGTELLGKTETGSTRFPQPKDADFGAITDVPKFKQPKIDLCNFSKLVDQTYNVYFLVPFHMKMEEILMKIQKGKKSDLQFNWFCSYIGIPSKISWTCFHLLENRHTSESQKLWLIII